jgi:hypothetical protein
MARVKTKAEVAGSCELDCRIPAGASTQHAQIVVHGLLLSLMVSGVHPVGDLEEVGVASFLHLDAALDAHDFSGVPEIAEAVCNGDDRFPFHQDLCARWWVDGGGDKEIDMAEKEGFGWWYW